MAEEVRSSVDISSDDISAEETPLVSDPNNKDNEGYSGGLVDSDVNIDVDDENDELDKPWPATFTRSISLLAGPTLDPSLIEQVTRSPRITPYQVRRILEDGSNRGYLTPQFRRAPTGSLNHHFKQGIPKIQSLDFRPTSANSAGVTSTDILLDLELREKESKLYRQKLLQGRSTGLLAKKSTDLTGAAHSPGYLREMETEVMKAKIKDDNTSVSSTKSSYMQCMFNMSNILMGVGMLGLPFIFKNAGWIGGVVVTFTFSAIAWRTSICLGRELNGDPRPCSSFDDDPYKTTTVPGSSDYARMRKPLESFPDIAREAFGQNGNVLLCFVLYFELFSCLSIFLVAIGDHMNTLFPEISVTRHMVHVSFLLSIPTALLRTPRLLSYLSAVGTIATFFVVLTVFSSALSKGDISEEVAERNDMTETSYHTLWRTSGLPTAFGLIAYTFSGHAIVPSIYVSMEQPKDFEKMITDTFLFVTLSCFIVAMSGYYMFGSTVDDQITLSLEKNAGSNSTSMEMLTWLMILTAFSKFTLTAFPLALGIEEICAPFLSSDASMDTVSSLIKLALIGLALIVAIYVPNFSFLCSLVGLICTMAVSVIFPAAAHVKMFGSRLPWWEKVFDYSLVLFGSILAIIGTVCTVFF